MQQNGGNYDFHEMPPSITGLKKTLPSHSENTCFGCPVSCGDFHVRKPRISAQITGLKKTLSHTSLGCRKCSSITQWANSQVKSQKCRTHYGAVENAVSHISGHVFLQPRETLGNWKSEKPEMPHTSLGCRKRCPTHHWVVENAVPSHKGNFTR